MKVRRQIDGVIREFGGKAFLIPISGTVAGSSNAFELNPVARQIWSRLPEEGVVAVDDIVDELIVIFAVSRGVLRADVATFLEELSRHGLVEVSVGDS